MAENSPKKYRYWITYLLKDLRVGDSFKPGLLHLTVIPWFVSEIEDEEVIEIFEQDFAGQTGFKVTIGEVTDFKHKRKIPVNLTKPTPELLSLHQKALDYFARLDGRWAVRSPHVDEEYIPHIRRRPGNRLKEGNEIQVNAVYLIKTARAEDGSRTVAAMVPLG